MATSSTKQCASGQRCRPVTLREALYCQAHHSELRLDAIARHLGISAGTLADAVNPNEDCSVLAAKHFDPLLALTPDNFAVVAYLATRQHAVVYALPTTEASDLQMAAVVREFGEFLTRHAEARADRTLTASEAHDIEREGQDAIRAIATVIEDAKREAASQGAQ